MPGMLFAAIAGGERRWSNDHYIRIAQVSQFQYHSHYFGCTADLGRQYTGCPQKLSLEFQFPKKMKLVVVFWWDLIFRQTFIRIFLLNFIVS